MKIIALLIYALFPFLHSTTYEATLSSCSVDNIVLDSKQSKIQVSLFNIKMINEEAGWIKTCSLLEDAKTITFEIDPSSKVFEPIPVWLFADDTLIQEELVAVGDAYPLIRNPEYTYEQRLEDAATVTQTMAEAEAPDTQSRYPFQGPLFMFVIFCIWLSILIRYIMKRKSKQNVNMKKDHNVVK